MTVATTALPLLLAADPVPLSAGDTAWVLMSSALVLLMVPGLAFFYGGLVRTKSALNTMLMSLGALAVVSVQWVLFGYSLAFGPGTSWLGSFAWLGFKGVGAVANPTYAATIPHLVFCRVPGHVRGHHGRAVLRRGGGSYALHRVSRVRVALVDADL